MNYEGKNIEERNNEVLLILLPMRLLQIAPPNMQNQPYLKPEAISPNSLIQGNLEGVRVEGAAVCVVGRMGGEAWGG